MGETLRHAITINERRGRDGGGKGTGSAYTQREVPSNCSDVVAPMHVSRNIPEERYDTRCYRNVRSKADMSQLNLPLGNNN